MITSILWVLLALTTMAQGFFEGVLTYKVTIEGENQEMLQEIMPHTYSLYFGKESFRFDMDGGMMPDFMGDIITFNKVEKSYIINEETNTAYLISNDEEGPKGSNFKIETLKERLEIKGYKCKGYEIVYDKPRDGLIKQDLWLTTELNLPLPTGDNHGIGAFFRDDLKGFALMVVNHFESDIGTYKVNIMLDKIEETYLPSSLFSIPDDFKIKVMDE